MAGSDIQTVGTGSIHTYLQKPSRCYLCNGFYGSSFEEYVCQTCHLFLFSEEVSRSAQENVHIKMEVEDDDSRNNEPADTFNNGFQRPVQNVPGDQFAPSQDLAQRFQLLSEMSTPRPQSFDGDNDYFQKLPPEILLTVFSYLDDFSLWCASKVCTRWDQLLRLHIPQSTWSRLAIECWPLYEPLKPVDDMHYVSSALISNSSCISCIRRMFHCSHTEYQEHWCGTRRLRREMKNLRDDPPEGIRAVPLNNHLYQWQATIIGPVGSPFEGGKFFLHLQLPYEYPLKKLVVRFLTKIFHPNVSRHGDIGLDFLHYNWYAALNIAKVLLSIQSLLTDPFCDVCMEPEIAQLYNTDKQKYNSIARYWTHKFAMNNV